MLAAHPCIAAVLALLSAGLLLRNKLDQVQDSSGRTGAGYTTKATIVAVCRCDKRQDLRTASAIYSTMSVVHSGTEIVNTSLRTCRADPTLCSVTPSEKN